MQPNTVKKKRTLKNIDFSKEDSHIAMVGPAVGGAANGANYALVMKAVNFSEEAIQKMQSIRVTLSVPEFLRRFFNMYYEEAEVLARVMGYEPPESDSENDMDSYEDYIESRVASFEVMKSMHAAEDFKSVLAELDESQYLSLLQDQETLEKAFKQADKKESKPVAKAKADDTSIASEVKKEEVSASATQQLEKKTMTTQSEMIEKSAMEALQKSFDEQKVALEKALETVAAFEKERKEAIAKARKAKLVDAVKDETKAEVLFKAVSLVESEEDFEAVVKALASMTAAVEKSALFEEKGATTDVDASKKEEKLSPVAKAMMANLKKQTA